MTQELKFPKLNDGDVFKIPLGDGRAAIGQIISAYFSARYVVIYDYVAPEEDVDSYIDDALKARPLFGGLTFDALFRPGR